MDHLSIIIVGDWIEDVELENLLNRVSFSPSSLLVQYIARRHLCSQQEGSNFIVSLWKIHTVCRELMATPKRKEIKTSKRESCNAKERFSDILDNQQSAISIYIVSNFLMNYTRQNDIHCAPIPLCCKQCSMCICSGFSDQMVLPSPLMHIPNPAAMP